MANVGAREKVKRLQKLQDGLFRKRSRGAVVKAILDEVGNARPQHLQNEAAVCAVGTVEEEMVQELHNMLLTGIVARSRQCLEDAQLSLRRGVCHADLDGDISLGP